jgi:hypothetical protein
MPDQAKYDRTDNIPALKPLPDGWKRWEHSHATGFGDNTYRQVKTTGSKK